MLKDVMEEYVVNPQNDFYLKPGVTVTACNYSASTVNLIQRLQVECSIQQKDTITGAYTTISIIDNCMIPSGMMSLGNTYRVAFVGYEPYQGPEALKASVWETAKTFSIYKNATKFSPIKLAKSPIIAKIIGGD